MWFIYRQVTRGARSDDSVIGGAVSSHHIRKWSGVKHL